jgi:hypothetical protein
MPTRFGADGGFASTTSGGVFDSSGNPIVSADNEFGAAPLGPAALAQTLFSVPNGTFNILPPDIEIPISNENPLPYWSSPVDDSDGEMTAQVVYNTTSNTYSLRMDPGSALNGYTLSITTRSAVISDDSLSLRQKAIATLEKVGTYAGTTQVNLKLDATYYDHTGTQISTNPIGTVFDNGTVSSLAEFTTAGTAIVGISAAYVDLTFTMTATADVTSGIAFDIDTILLQTSQGGGGGAQSFLITETFTSSDTWTKPTGVDYLVAVWGVGGGGGGAGGGCWCGHNNTMNGYSHGVGGGGGGRLAVIRDLYIGDQTTISIGVGAGGSGGTATSVSKTAAGTAQVVAVGGNGSSGGATTFGAYLSIPGGGGGSFGGTTTTGGSGGGAGGTVTSNVLGYVEYAAGAGGAGGNSGTATLPTNAGAAGTSAVRTFKYFPYAPDTLAGVGSDGGSATHTVTGSGFVYVGTASAAGTGVNYFSGGGGATGGLNSNAEAGVIRTNSAGAAGGGGAGAQLQMWNHSTSPAMQALGTAGTGGSAGANTGAGGGAGGGAGMASANDTRYSSSVRGTAYSGAGGNGGSGLVVIAYIG